MMASRHYLTAECLFLSLAGESGTRGETGKKCSHKMREVIEGGEVGDGADGRRHSDG